MKQLTSDRIVTYLVLAAMVLKLGLWLRSGRFEGMFSDENRNYQIALNHQNGDGYTIDGKLTAFHASTPVLIYEWLIKNDIPKGHFVKFGHVLSILLFGLSIYYFNGILLHFNVPRWLRYGAIVLYVLYPSNLEFIGNKFNYERLALPVFLISFYHLLNLARADKPIKQMLAVAISMAVVTLFRPQFIYIMPFVIGCFGLFWLLKKHRHWLRYVTTLVLMLLFTFVAHIPELNKNHRMFGAHILSTQAGFELMQGHCDIARGSWNGEWEDPDSDYANYSRKMIPGIDGLNEYEQSKARMAFAADWIRKHPVQELELIARKVAIFFIPMNFLGGFNLVNAAVHALFLLAVFRWLLQTARTRTLDWELATLLTPLAAVLSLSIIFFVGYRWRYYTEPFMIIWIAIWVAKMVSGRQLARA